MKNEFTTEPARLDPARLSKLRGYVEAARSYLDDDAQILAEVLAARDYWRRRCTVTAADVKEQGVGWRDASKWFEQRMESEREGDGDWTPWSREPDNTAALINELSRDFDLAPWDILDEMARIAAGE